MVEIRSRPLSPMLRAWFQPLLERGTTFAAENLRTQMAFLQAGELEFPLSYNDNDWENSWVCSPWTHYITCGQEETQRYAPPWLVSALKPVWWGLGKGLKLAQFNRVVVVNNWLLSTVPWPALPVSLVRPTLEALIQRWPDHALVFRSLNARESGPLLEALAAAGALIIPSRQVWWFDPHSQAVARSRYFQRDARLLHKGDLSIVPHEALQEEDFPRLRELYVQLYLEKYSRHNPRFTTGWLWHLHQAHLLHFTALREASGRIVGVEAYAQHHGIITSPVVGYELSLPQGLGLYRRLAVAPLLASRRLGLPLNLSAGVGPYKAARGGEPTMEYMAVLTRHLPTNRQLPWKMIEQISQHLLAPAVRRMGL